jgi:hypothetical protein
MDTWRLRATAGDGTPADKTGLAYWEAAEWVKQYAACDEYVEVTITREGWYRDTLSGNLYTDEQLKNSAK